MTRRRADRSRRRPTRVVVLAVVATGIGLLRKQKLDAADAAFPEAVRRA